MARKPKTAESKGTPRYGSSDTSPNQRIEFTFINVSPNRADVDWLLANEDTAAALVLEFLSTLPSGYKLSCSFDKQSSRFNATLTCSAADDPNYGLILSFRGATASDALYGLAYADLRKLEGEWRRGSEEPASRFG